MTGGGGRVRRGRMGKSAAGVDVSPRDLENLEASLQNQIQTAAAYRDERIKLDGLISQSEKELASYHHILTKNKNEYLAVQDHQTQLSKQIVEQKPRVLAAAPDKKMMSELQSKLNTSTKGYNEANEAAQEIDAKVKKLHGEITAITKGKYGAVQKVIDKLVKEITTVRTNINKCATAAKTALRNQKKSETKFQSLNEELEEENANLKKVNDDLDTLVEVGRDLLAKRGEAKKELSEMDEKKKSMMKEINGIKDKELQLRKNKIEHQEDFNKKDTELKKKEARAKETKDDLAKLRLQKIEGESDEFTPDTLPILNVRELDSVSTNAVSFEISTLEGQMNKMKPNMSAIAEYKRKEEMHKKKVEELDQATKERDEMKKHHDDLRRQRLEEFLAGFRIITSKLKEVYQMITLGGDAELELVDSLDPFTEGIVFSVRPPKKSWKNITNLSGGEKTLSSLALVFALHYYKPTPFYVMDEIDAALDFKNVSIVGNYIKERTKNAQFIIISLRNNMFELADRLVGIFKVFNCTKTVTISPGVLSEQEADNVGERDEGNDRASSSSSSILTNSQLFIGEP